MKKPVHIVSIRAERFKRLQAFLLEPLPTGLTVIGGANSQGKTSALHAISSTLGGARFKPSDPNNRGFADPAWTKIKLSNGLIVQRHGKNFTLKVTDSTGLKGNQGVLGAFVEELALDLPKFMESTPKKKGEILLRIIGVGGELDSLEKGCEVAYERRKDLGKDLKRIEAQMEGESMHADVPVEKIVLMDLFDELQTAENAHTAQKILGEKIEGHKDAILSTRDEIAKMEALIESRQVKLSKLAAKLDGLNQEFTFALVPDLGPIKEKIKNADSVNEKIAENYALIQKQKRHKELNAEYQMVDSAIRRIRSNIGDLLASAKMPLDGLSIHDGELNYNGAKWDCMGSAEQLMVATSIVRELNPQCGFVLLDKLEQMDIGALREFGGWAQEHGLQIIATRVSDGDECAVIIEDGKDDAGREQESENLSIKVDDV